MTVRRNSKTPTSPIEGGLIVYLSGPMRGYPNENLELFYARAQQLEDAGYVVFNPHELSRQLRLANGVGEYEFGKLPFEVFLRNDYRYVTQSDVVGVLPGWEKSVGAGKEVRVARDLKIPVYTVSQLLDGRTLSLRGLAEQYEEVRDPEPTILEQANGLVNGPRQKQYGHPYDNDRRAAGMIKAKFGWDIKISDVWQVMELIKLGREQNAPLRDTRVDIAGYAGVGQLVQERIDAGYPNDPFAPVPK